MKGSIVLIMVCAFILTSCDLFVTSEDKTDDSFKPISREVSISPSDPCLGDTLRASLVGDGYSYRWERAETKNGVWESLWSSDSTHTLRKRIRNNTFG